MKKLLLLSISCLLFSLNLQAQSSTGAIYPCSVLPNQFANSCYQNCWLDTLDLEEIPTSLPWILPAIYGKLEQTKNQASVPQVKISESQPIWIPLIRSIVLAPFGLKSLKTLCNGLLPFCFSNTGIQPIASMTAEPSNTVATEPNGPM